MDNDETVLAITLGDGNYEQAAVASKIFACMRFTGSVYRALACARPDFLSLLAILRPTHLLSRLEI
jgi:hypothetical protein